MAPTENRETDAKGRILIADLTDSEKLTEIVTTMREIADALESMGNNPMLKALLPGGFGR